jgi:chemotaxis protein MotB
VARKKREEEAGGQAEWLATFSDLNNLLLCFFVMLFAMSTIDAQKLEAAAQSIQSSLGIFKGGETAIGEGIMISNGVSQLNVLDEYMSTAGMSADGDTDPENIDNEGGSAESQTEEEMQAAIDASNLEENERKAEAIEEILQESGMADKVDLSVTSDYVKMSLSGALLFESGQTDIREESFAVLQKVGVILEKYADGTIDIEGHTDNVPISNNRFANNDELSNARALSIFYYLRDNTYLNPADIKHSGRGDYVPIADNGTDAGRARNRRVEIKIYNDKLN